MYLGGVLLGAGMELHIAPGDHANGPQPLQFLLTRVVGTRDGSGGSWVVLEGRERPAGAFTFWRNRRIHVRIDALKRSLTLTR